MSGASGSEDRQVFLKTCLLEGDSASEKRARRVKQRAILVSIILQILVVAALVLVPLLSRGENIAGRVIYNPPVPIGPSGPVHQNNNRTTQGTHRHINVTGLFAPASVPSHLPDPNQMRNEDPFEPSGPYIPGLPSREGTPGGGLDGIRINPDPPKAETLEVPPRLKVSGPVQQAMLTHRVEPVYPRIAIQIHKEGRVELRAIIATDGSVEALEVVSGDPLLIRSALDAVSQWHYNPTTINGQAVEVDTFITVIYTLSH